MLSEDLDYKISKYTIKLRNAESKKKEHYYQRKLRQYHQINQFGGFINDCDNGKRIMRDLKMTINQAFEQSKTDPELFNEFSKVINDNSVKIRQLSDGMTGGHATPPSETLLNTVQQFFEKSDNIRDMETQDSDHDAIY